ncbi:FAD binding domain-containing protein [Afifella pfennigii]|uniref:FAD binding domain-containing protein n=1 Tax=Afifella pfennigii TaxID=209897 RepID=UPI00047EBC95|nr:FAD binding domain-containing protein [Afifella pfennigii]
MKPVPFDLVVAKDVAGAVKALGEEGAKAVGGFQSLGPMLNLRLAQPRILIDVTRIPELRGIQRSDESVVYGACITHAEFEDGAVFDPTGGALARVASGIAYRAVRTRGTIGGSLAHGDPAADWPVALGALDARVRIAGERGVRQMPVASFMTGAFATALQPNEVVVAVEVPRPSPQARFGFWKFCRKVGELAEAICGVYCDPERGVHRIMIGAMEGRPVVLADVPEVFEDARALEAALADLDLGSDPVHRKLHLAAIKRAVADMRQVSGASA